MRKQLNIGYHLGLDIGIASVGWCLLLDNLIINLGVYAFDKAESEKGEALNITRRTARLNRRRLHHRYWRLQKLAHLLKKHGVIEHSGLFSNQTQIAKSLWVLNSNGKLASPSLWELRVAALDKKLEAEAWARVIYHICKHRGFWFGRKIEAENTEGGKVKQGLEATRKMMSGKNYHSVAQMMLAEYPKHQRNKRGSYLQSIGREQLAEELETLFTKQRELGNHHASVELQSAILDVKNGLFWQQKPALSGDAVLKMLGNCTFERNEYRLAKNTWSAERFIWLQKLNNLRVNVDGDIRPLSLDEREAVVDLPYKFEKLTYKQLKSKLIKTGLWIQNADFIGISAKKDKDPEATVLVELKSWHGIKKALEKVGLKTEWQSLATQHEQLDSIGNILSLYKTDEEIKTKLGELTLSTAVINALLNVSFSKFIHLSLKVTTKILPFLEQGERYDEACSSAGYNHSQPNLQENKKRLLLPSFYMDRDKSGKLLRLQDVPNNPVVLRALNQARKVVNAIIREYGSPDCVHIEMARDLSKSYEERKDITKQQKKYRANNEQERMKFVECFFRCPSMKEFRKWNLYHEQECKCAYSQQPIDLNRLINEANYCEIDHILPRSRSFDYSKNNEVLVLSRENQQKGNKTPFEYLNGASDSECWQAFVSFVNSNKNFSRAKKERLLRKNFDELAAEEFKDRNLNDTRYACRFFKNFVEHNLQLHTESKAKRCVAVNGAVTNFLRHSWGLAKLREGSDRHHAIDAAVVAACGHGLVKRLSDYSRTKELKNIKSGFADLQTGEVKDIEMAQRIKHDFPVPWEHFTDELCLRAGIHLSTGEVCDILATEPEKARAALAKFGYSADKLLQVKPMFVVRAVKKRSAGSAHKDTIYKLRPTKELPNRVTQKIALTELSLANFEFDSKKVDSLIEPERNQKLYSALLERLQEYGGDGKKAFAEPFYKPCKISSKAPLVRSVTKAINSKSGVEVRKGLAENETMLRVDVFSKATKFYLVPIYVHHLMDTQLPNKAILAHKNESEWTLIDDSFSFKFSLYPNDLVRFTGKKIEQFGYYRTCHRGNGSISLCAHDRNQQVGGNGLISHGVKTAISIEKFYVDLLGNIYSAPKEERRGLA